MPYGRDRTIIIPDLFIVTKLLEEQSKTATDIQFETRMTYSHIHIVKNGMSKKGLLTLEKKGREQYMSLTFKGQKFLKIVNEYLEFFKITNEEMLAYRRAGRQTKKRLETQELIVKDKKEEEKNDIKKSIQMEHVPPIGESQTTM